MKTPFQANAIGFAFLVIPIAAGLLWGWEAALLAAGVAALYYGVSSP